MKLDILAIAAHPDDVELSCGATLLRAALEGKKTGIVDMTKGEMGSRGTSEQRLQEADDAGKIMKLAARENLGFKDAFFEQDEYHLMEVIKAIRHYRPDILLTNTPSDRHPDHGRASKLVSRAAFMAGLSK